VGKSSVDLRCLGVAVQFLRLALHAGVIMLPDGLGGVKNSNQVNRTLHPRIEAENKCRRARLS